MLHVRHPILAALLTTSTVVTIALVWFGLRSLEQEQAVDHQQARERVENGADAIAAGIRGKLAEAGERLSDWVSHPGSPSPALENAVVLTVGEKRFEVAPRHALPFFPVAQPAAAVSDAGFAGAEALELTGNHMEEAARLYRILSRHADPRIRAEALLRLGRVQRKSRNFAGALESYRQLAKLPDITVAGLPAELVALDGERLTQTDTGDSAGAQQTADEIARSIDDGRWILLRGPAEFYRDLSPRRPKPESWLLADAMARLWETNIQTASGAGSLRVFDVENRPVLAIGRSNGSRSALMAAFPDRWFARQISTGFAYQLTDAAGKLIAGAAPIPSRTVDRLIGDAQNPWMIHIWFAAGAPRGGSRLGSRFLVAMLAIVILFLWGTVYFMARAIHREAKVARLQTDFVAAVSHEFRSPLTTVRQLAEMLEMDQVPSESRRRRYYHTLAAEALRLQRLVETLLNFGSIEAGAQQYRFVTLDVAELVARAVLDLSGEQNEAANRVHISGAQSGIHVLGDSDALTLALRNLVENALKYSSPSEQVHVHWSSYDGQVEIAVADRGPGIPREEQQAVFEKFVRGRSAIAASIKGTGVGLAMVRSILRAHGGEVRLESEPGFGCTFSIILAEAKEACPEFS